MPEQAQGISSKRNNNLSLQTRLVLFVLLVALVPLIFIAIRDILQTQQALTNGAKASLESNAIQTANSVDAFIQATLDSIGIEAQLNDFVAYLTLPPSQRSDTQAETTALELLNKLRRKGELFHEDFYYINSYALVNTDGIVVLDTASSNLQKDESKEPYFPQTQSAIRPIISVATYAENSTTSITFASKVVNSHGDYIGILRVKYYVDIFQNVIDKSVGTTTDASVLLLDPLHIRMADNQHPELLLKSVVPLSATDYLLAVNSNRLLPNVPAEFQATNYPDFEQGLDNAEKQPFFTADITPKTTGTDTIAVAFLKTQPWIVAYSRPTSIFLADVQKQIRINIILVIGILILITSITAVMARSLTNPITALAKAANSISQGDLSARADINSTDEIGVLASAFNSMTDQLQSTLVGLEQRVNERTADLQKSTLEMETIAIVTREISIIRDVDTLLKVSVELIRERLKYYHVGIFLVNERGEYAVLRAASGAAAEQLLAKNYKLKVGQEGLVGNVIRAGKANIALDAGTDAAHFQNPLLPQTRSEIMLPLRSRNIIIGTLDIQTEVPSAFSEQSIKVLQLLADQVAAAIENAQLAQQVETAFAEINNAYRMQTQSAWQAAINQYERPSYEYDGLQVRAVPQNLPNDLLKQLENGKPIIVKENTGLENNRAKTTLMVPLMALNQVIGVIGLEQEDPNHIWTDEEISIAQAAASRAGITLENVRLLEESQRRAVKERTIFNATARIGSAVNVENILQITAEELERVLINSEVVLQFQPDHDQKPKK
jgi:GAF domain-containing protein/HAMP domain-containing protein